MQERLDIRARYVAGRLQAVTIASGRKVTAASGLAGQPVDRALVLLPLIFSLCGRAQGIAAARAVEAALGQEPSPAAQASRRLLLAAESVQELWMPVLMDWPGLIGGTAYVEQTRALRSVLMPLWAEGDQRAVDTALDAADSLAVDLGDSLDSVLAAAEDGQGPWGAMLRWVIDQGLEGFGASDVAPLPEDADVAPWVAADTDGAFRRAPVWAGQAAETGPLARQWDHPAVAEVRAVHGSGLLARVVARAADLAAQARAMRDAAEALWQTGADRCAVAPPEVPAQASGQGAGRAEAARGTLIHWVDMADGQVRDWRILAPTEWNFHPQGVLARGLENARAGGEPYRSVRLLAAVIDPCVGCDVTVES